MDALLSSELSADTLAALQAHLQTQQAQQDAAVSEDFRLSQLCVSSRQWPTDDWHTDAELLPVADFLKIQEESDSPINGDNVYLFEFDRRFDEKYSGHFVFYDYNEPTNLPEKFHHFFDYVLVDPPYLVRRGEIVACGHSLAHLVVLLGRTPTAWASLLRPCAGCRRM
ncbi:unnamed protein product [Phytophthora lilii]|uniref:Unnamed protein product n=1 Tax=Phytophthora lilii TaxID=2077276 RepID=A0A9W6U2R3_9STRA|nr:unnamed protein product [Phytophthora lilii]